jgi:polyisoprenoid-binding protein YceI
MTQTKKLPPRFPVQPILAGLFCALALLLAPALRAQESGVRVDPGETKIEFSLGSTLHTVHGTFALKSSTLRFDPATGKLSGAIVVDATSGASGNDGRDSRMHREILESAKFPEIVFTPTQLTGAVAPAGTSKVQITGQFRLHGRDHDMTLPAEIVADGQKLQVAMHFVIPYIEWGLKNPSTFMLRASDKVEVEVHATGHVDTTAAAH